MTIYARTGEMRRSAGDYGKAATSAREVATQAAAGTRDLSAAVEDPAVATALSAALVAVLRELQLVGGAYTYGQSQIQASANAYDDVDRSTATHLSGAFRAR